MALDKPTTIGEELPATLSMEDRHEALGALVDRYQRQVFETAMRLLGSKAEADDVTQETFLKAHQALHSFKGKGSMGRWLQAIAVNLCMDKMRKGRRLVPFPQAPNPYEPLERTDPEREAARRQVALRVRGALEGLPPRQRAVFVLKHWEGLSLARISQLLGITEGAVKAHLFNSVRRMRKALRDCYGP